MITTTNLSVQAAASRYQAANTSSTAANSDVFMEILLAQMRNQNPMEPMKDGEMMTQFSQLNSLQTLMGMKDMLAEIASMGQVEYGASLVGCTVRAKRADGSTVEGEVSGVSFQAGSISMTIDDEKVPLDNLLEVIRRPDAGQE